MHPVSFYLGSRPIYWYGVMMAMGFLAVTAYWSLVSRRESRPPGYATNLAFWIFAGGLVGARALYVILNMSYYLRNPLEIIMIQGGGLVFQGGLIGGAAAVLLLGAKRRESPWMLGDLVLSGLPLGHALGRIGCFLNGCCYGKPAACACGIAFPPESAPAQHYGTAPLHPTQLYEAGLALLLFAVLSFYYPRRSFNGQIIALYMVGYGAIRFALEFLRGDTLPIAAGMTVFQWISLALLVIGISIAIFLSRGRRK